MNKTAIKGYCFAILSAVIYGCMPLMAKYIYADGVTALSLVFFRNVFALVPLGILAYRQHGSLKVPVKQLPAIGLISVMGCSITPILLLSSYQFIESSTATVFHFIYPAIVVLAEIVFLRKKAQLSNLLSVLICIIGISLFYAPQQSPDLTGSILALTSGLSFAIYVVLLSHFDSRSVSGFLFTFYITAVSSIVTLIVCLVSGTLVFPASLSGWGLTVLFSLLITVGAVVLFQQSAFLIGSERVSILSTLEPITSIVIGILIFHDPSGPRVLIGSSLVVLASLLIALFDFRRTKQQ